MSGLALLAATLLAASLVVPPPTEPADTAATDFSAERARQDLEVVAAEPHPVRSAAQERVRSHLRAQADALDLPVEVQRDDASGAQNVIVRIPGTSDSGRDVLITAHYDSTPNGPGAGDNGMAVAAMVETMRVLHEREPLANDVVLLFTDGEEAGQAGIAAFIEDHRGADRIAVAFVFEGLPESGGTELRTTTPGDAWLVGELADASLPIFANSALNASDRDRAGNDFAALAPAGIVGAEFLTEGHVVRYHTAEDDVGAVDLGVVQDHGDTMVALAEHFGNLDLTAARVADHDRVFFSAPVVGLVSYPVWAARVLSAVAVLALLAVLGLAWRRRLVSGRDLVGGTLALPVLAVALTVLAWATWQLLLRMNPESEKTLQYPDFEGSTAAMAVIGAAAGVAFVAACYRLARRLGVLALAIGALVWWALAAVLLAIGQPLFSAVALWPLVGGVVAVAATAWISHPWARAGALVLAAVPGLVIAVPLLVLEALNVEDGPVVAVPVLILLLGSLLPQLLPLAERPSPARGTASPASSVATA